MKSEETEVLNKKGPQAIELDLLEPRLGSDDKSDKKDRRNSIYGNSNLGNHKTTQINGENNHKVLSMTDKMFKAVYKNSNTFDINKFRNKANYYYDEENQNIANGN
jgi:hypothetical protein